MSRRVWRRSVAALGTAVVVAVTAEALSGPYWWNTRGVVDTNSPPGDFSPANQGQAKWMATQAAAEFDAYLPGGSGAAVSNLLAGFSTTNNWLPLNLGQLKTLATPFYDRLAEAGITGALPPGVTGAYPWTSEAGDDADFAMANLGQLASTRMGWDVLRVGVALLSSDGIAATNAPLEVPLLTASITAGDPFDPADPVVNVLYTNTSGTYAIRILTPFGELERGLVSVNVRSDGKWWSEIYENAGDVIVYASTIVEPRTSILVRYRLSDCYRVPADWTNMAVSANHLLMVTNWEYCFDRHGRITEVRPYGAFDLNRLRRDLEKSDHMRHAVLDKMFRSDTKSHKAPVDTEGGLAPGGGVRCTTNDRVPRGSDALTLGSGSPQILADGATEGRLAKAGTESLGVREAPRVRLSVRCIAFGIGLGAALLAVALALWWLFRSAR